MGMVYEAFDKTLHRKVAVKVMRPETLAEPRARERFLEEARTVAALHHPAIIDIHAIVEDKDGLCLVFEHLEGQTIEELLRRRGKLTLAEARSLLKPVCQGLEFAHRHGVVHRDLKPGNIMVTASGQVKLMDFGISRHESGRPQLMTAAERATARGTPHYMAPEQECGEVRRESDVYSLGACLYEMLTGERPFPAPHSIGDKLSRRYTPASKLAPGLPPAVDGLIEAALQPDPHERTRSPQEFLAGLERITATSPAATA
jgi:eukaryotic-like serine/threonine-protein kinase